MALVTIGDLPDRDPATVDPADLVELQTVAGDSVKTPVSALVESTVPGMELHAPTLVWGEGSRVVWTFPVPFDSAPRVFLSPQWAGFNTPVCNVYSITATTVEVIGYTISTADGIQNIAAGTEYTVSMLCVGGRS